MWTRSEPAQAARPDKERFAISTDPAAAALARAVAAARIEGTAARAADTDLPGTAGLEAGIAGPVVGTVRLGIAAEGIAIGSGTAAARDTESDSDTAAPDTESADTGLAPDKALQHQREVRT